MAGATIAILILTIRWQRKSLSAFAATAIYVSVLLLTSNLWLETVTSRLDIKQDIQQRQAFDLEHRTSNLHHHLSALGGALFLLEDWHLQQQDAGYVPTRAEIQQIGAHQWKSPIAKPTRNIHIALLESIWDTSVLDNVVINGPAIDPRFMSLWRAAGSPHALSPVIGGSTANAEFEVLCGFPAPGNSISFVGSLRNRMPCLPAIFKNLGYRTIASHPHLASNWSRDTAYDRLGFQVFNSLDSFTLEPKDLDGPFLTDKSMFQQNLELIEPIDSEQPTFNYVVSLSSHWAYSRNEVERPTIVDVKPASLKLLHDYVNSSAYTTSAFMDWAESILAADPDALIIAFGDHAPVLDAEPDIYKEISNRVGGRFEDAHTRQLVGMSRVPLLILDGMNGPTALAEDTPLYQLPQIIGNLLHSEQLLPYASPRNSDIIVRTVPEGMLARIGGTWRRCGSASAKVEENGCKDAWSIHQRNKLVRQDLAVGKNYFLKQASAEQLVQDATPIQINHRFKSCEYEIDQWGPRQGTPGKAINSGNPETSLIWITFRSLRGQPDITIGNVAVEEVHAPLLITASIPTIELPNHAADVPVKIRCPNEDATQVGVIQIR